MADIFIKYWPHSPLLEQKETGGCIDLYNLNELCLRQGEMGTIHFGVAMDLGDHDALIFPRSSTFQRYGILLTNSIGYIDSTYNGPDDEWLAKVYATRDITIPAGTRCFQFRLIEKQPKLNFILSDLTENSNRSGYGSTGV